MVRAALSQSKRFDQGPSRYAMLVPAATVVGASLLAALPIVTQTGWFPDFGFLALVSWRLLRADPWPPGGPLLSVSSTTCSPDIR